MSKRVLKWRVPVDGQAHRIGGGPVALVAWQHHLVTEVVIWTEEGDPAPKRTVRVYGTGHPIPDTSRHLGSVVIEPYVWHVYEEALT